MIDNFFLFELANSSFASILGMFIIPLFSMFYASANIEKNTTLAILRFFIGSVAIPILTIIGINMKEKFKIVLRIILTIIASLLVICNEILWITTSPYQMLKNKVMDRTEIVEGNIETIVVDNNKIVVKNEEEPEEDVVDDNETVVASDDFKAWLDIFNSVIKSNTGLPMFDEAYGSTVEINENANGTYDLYANIYNPQFTEETFCRDTFILICSLIESNDYQKYFRNIDIDFTSDLNTISHNIKIKNYYKRKYGEIENYIIVE